MVTPTGFQVFPVIFVRRFFTSELSVTLGITLMSALRVHSSRITIITEIYGLFYNSIIFRPELGLLLDVFICQEVPGRMNICLPGK